MTIRDRYLARLLGLCLAGSLSLACGGASKPRFMNADHSQETSPDPAVVIQYAQEVASGGDSVRAEQYLNWALALGASEEEVLPLLVGICAGDKRYRDAIGHLQRFLRRHPTRARARFMLATLFSAVGQIENARMQFERLLGEAPKFAEAHYAYAVVLRDELADPGNADHHFRQYLSLRPEGNHVEEARGSLLEQVQ